MAKEINLSYISGITVTAQLYLNGVAAGSPFSVPEIGTTGEYQADMPAVSAGDYLVVFLNGAAKITAGWIYWDGSQEVDVKQLVERVDHIVVNRQVTNNTTGTTTIYNKDDTTIYSQVIGAYLEVAGETIKKRLK